VLRWFVWGQSEKKTGRSGILAPYRAPIWKEEGGRKKKEKKRKRKRKKRKKRKKNSHFLFFH
jgi:hypothetical protein